jgi:sodium/proline symporter
MINAMIILAIVAYLVLVVYIGFYFSKKNASTDDFYLGGRRLGPFVTAMSAEASDMSSWLLMGLPGVALAGVVGLTGTFAEAVWTAVGLALGTYLNWLIVAKPLRHYSEKIGAFTIPDFFSFRYGEKKGVLLVISAIIIIVFFVPYTASGFSAIGKLFNSLFGVNYHTAMIIGACVIALYTILGGFLAASTTDFIQSIIMTIALLVIIGVGVNSAGGFGAAMDNAANAATAVPKGHYFSLNGAGSYGLLPIISTMAWGLGYFGMPHILLRFMAIDDKEKLKMSRRIATIWVVIAMFVAIFIGVIGYSFCMKNGIINKDFDPERIIVYMARTIAKINPFVALVAGVILAGILASVMSTADSQMLAASSSVSENIVKRFFMKDADEKRQIRVARIAVICIAIVAVFFAWNPDSSVFRIVAFAWAGFGASFGPLMLFSLFWRRTNVYGAVAGVICGGAMVFIWKFGIAKLGGVFAIYELLPAFIFNCIVLVVVSLLTPAPGKEVTDVFDEVKAMK